jgi:hypothetical protein
MRMREQSQLALNSDWSEGRPLRSFWGAIFPGRLADLGNSSGT